MDSQYNGEPAGSTNGYASASQSSDRSPLGSLPFLKNLTAEEKKTKDGQTPKRRGPKPDSKPALTRRQELNRQAQRTHRERKELYIKALEQEVLRLKEIYADSTRERDQIYQENLRLKELLRQHGISYDFGDTPVRFQRENSGYGVSSSGSISGSYAPPSESSGISPPPPNGLPMHLPPGQMRPLNGSPPHSQMDHNMARLPSNRLDYDQVGIDFVLAYDSQGRPFQVPAPYPSPPPQ